MLKVRLSKHDRYIEELCGKIKHDYDSISTNVPITKKKRSLGEIDVLAKKGNRVDLFEVKCSYRITKARKQAQTQKKHLQMKINNCYFYCGATSSLVLL